MSINTKIRIGLDGKYYINIPSLGIDTYAENESDIQIALKEALTGFFIAYEEYGLGIKEELARLHLDEPEYNDPIILIGEDAKRFNDAIANPNQISKKEMKRMKKNYEILKSRERF